MSPKRTHVKVLHFSEKEKEFIDQVIDKVIAFTRIEKHTLFVRARHRDIIVTRTSCYKICREQTNWTLEKIGQIFNKSKPMQDTVMMLPLPLDVLIYDHSTVLSALKNYDDWKFLSMNGGQKDRFKTLISNISFAMSESVAIIDKSMMYIGAGCQVSGGSAVITLVDNGYVRALFPDGSERFVSLDEITL